MAKKISILLTVFLLFGSAQIQAESWKDSLPEELSFLRDSELSFARVFTKNVPTGEMPKKNNDQRYFFRVFKNKLKMFSSLKDGNNFYALTISKRDAYGKEEVLRAFKWDKHGKYFAEWYVSERIKRAGSKHHHHKKERSGGYQNNNTKDWTPAAELQIVIAQKPCILNVFRNKITGDEQIFISVFSNNKYELRQWMLWREDILIERHTKKLNGPIEIPNSKESWEAERGSVV